MTSSEYMQKWREKHPNYYHEYRKKNRARINELHRLRQKKYREAHKEQIKNYNKQYFQTHRTECNKRKRLDQKRHPDRLRARNLAYRLVPLDNKCATCGSTENLQRHHPDYSKPLKIVTLCARCHLERKFGDENKEVK